MPNIYKKKNPRTKYIKQIVLYGICLLVCIVIRQWTLVPVFALLILFAVRMLVKYRDAEAHSLADYIHQYDNSFPTESPKEQEKEKASRRKQEYEDFIGQVLEEAEFDYREDDDDEQAE